MRHRNYALLWTGQLISNVGDRFHFVAISLWVYAKTGSALPVTYAMIALLAGSAVVGPFAGALVDRLDRRKILIYGDLARAALVFALPDLMEWGLAWVYLALFLVSIATAFFRPAMFAAIPHSVPKDRLLQANALFASMSQSTEVFGPPLAGLTIAWRDYPAAIYLNALSFLVSAIFVSALRLPEPVPTTSGPNVGSVQRTFESIRTGLRYVRGDTVQVALLALVLGGFWVIGMNSLQTPLAKGVIGATDRQFGWFQGIWGTGFVVGSLLLGWFGTSLPRGRTIIFGYLLWAIATGAMGLSVNYGMLVITGFWVGFANMLVFVNVATLMMEYTPSNTIGRAITTRQVLVAVVSVISMLAFGWLADSSGIRAAVVTMASVSFVGALAATVRFPVLWRYGVQSVPTEQSAGAISRETTLGRFPGGVARFLEAHIAPDLPRPGQQTLNAAVLLIVGFGWLALVVTLPLQALGLLAVVGGTLVIARVAHSIGRRLRAQLGRHEGGGGDAAR